MVQRNTFAPTPKPVIPEVGELEVVIVPAPETSVHEPVPTVAVLPASVAEVAHTVWSAPAAATVGLSLLVMVTSSEVAVQGALLMVQRNTFAPTPKPVIPEVGELEEVIVPLPETSVHDPVPTVAVLPARVAVVAHIVWSAPALAAVGLSLLVMVTSSDVAAQGALVMVQRNTLVPTANPVMPEFAALGEVIVAVPETNVHDPVPAVGVLPARVAVAAHTVWSAPALAIVVLPFLVITISSEDATHGALDIVHLKVTEPVIKPVIPEEGELGEVMVPIPKTLVHNPVPVEGIFPARLVEEAQTV